MSTKSDWLHNNNEELYAQATLTYAYILEEPQRTRMGFKAGTVQGDWLDKTFVPRYTAFAGAVRQWQDPALRTRAHSVALRAAKEDFTAAYRTLYTAFLKRSPLVTDEDVVSMGLPVRRTGRRTPVPVPETYPVGMPDTSVLRRVAIRYADSGHERSKAMPYGVHGAEIRWKVFDRWQTPALDDLTESSFSARRLFVRDFGEGDRGKFFYYALCWENKRGRKGPFGEIACIVIP